MLDNSVVFFLTLATVASELEQLLVEIDRIPP